MGDKNVIVQSKQLLQQIYMAMPNFMFTHYDKFFKMCNHASYLFLVNVNRFMLQDKEAL